MPISSDDDIEFVEVLPKVYMRKNRAANIPLAPMRFCRECAKCIGRRWADGGLCADCAETILNEKGVQPETSPQSDDIPF